ADPRPVPALHGRRGQDGAHPRRRLQPLPAAAPQRQGQRRGDGFAGLHRHRGSREPPARTEGGDGRAGAWPSPRGFGIGDEGFVSAAPILPTLSYNRPETPPCPSISPPRIPNPE